MTHAPMSEKPTHFRWTVIGLACGTSWLLYLHRYTFALLKPQLQEEWGISKSELGLLDSAFSLFYKIFQLPLGIAADLAGVHLVLTGMILFWSAGLGLHAWAASPKELWLARAILGAGQSGVFASLNRITRTWVPVAVRTTAQGWIGVFFGRFGGLSANLLVATVMIGILEMSWRSAVWVMAAVGIAHGLLFGVLFRNSPREHPAVNRSEAECIEGDVVDESATRTARKRMSIRMLLQRMSPRSVGNLLLLNIQLNLSAFADNLYSSWIPLFLFDVHGLEAKEMGIYSALPLLGGAIGGAMAGTLNDWMIRRLGNRRWARSLIGFTGKSTAGALLLVALLWYEHPHAFCIMLFFVKLFSDWSLTTTWGTVTDIGGNATATVFALNNALAGVAALIAPIVYGTLADHHGWLVVFWVAAGAYLLCGASWLTINCTIPVIAEQRDSSGD